MAVSKLSKISYWAFGVVVAGVVLLTLGISFLDWNKYRTTLSDLASKQMDMRVELAGNVSVALFPRPSVSAETVRIAPMGQGNSDIVATADRISMRLGVSSFLRGDIAIQSLVLEGLNVALDETASGKWKVRGWPDTAEGGPIDLLRLDIENGRLALKPLVGDERTIEQLNLHLSGELPVGPLEWQGSFDVDGQAVETDGRLKPVSVRDEVSIKSEVRIAGSVFQISGRAAPNGDMTARLLFEGQQLGAAYQSVLAILGSQNATPVPNIPYSLDVQLDIDGGIARIVSRQLKLHETRGRLDLTVARKGTVNHMAGAMSLGVIDVEAWRAATPDDVSGAETAASGNSAPSQMTLSGAIDLTLEGARMNGGLGQRIDAVLAFQPDGPSVTSLQALLPGAASLSLVGNLGANDGTAKVRLDVGNLPDLTNWLAIELPDAIPAGRLSTASAKASLEYREGMWALTELSGLLDTSQLEGELSGESESLVPSHVKLSIDSLDLDIFNSSRDGVSTPLLHVPEGLDIALDISTADLHGFEAGLGKARFVGAIKSGRLEVDYLTLERGNGSLKVEGALTNADEDVALELAADFENWQMHIARHFVPGLHQYLLAANMETLSGTASAAGAFSKMRLGFDATANEQDISLSGEIGFPQNRLTFVNLQGGLKHKDLAGVARQLAFGDYKKLPAQLTYSLSKAGAGDLFEARIGGDIAGGKMQAAVSLGDKIEKLELTFDHENVGRLQEAVGRQLTWFDGDRGLRSEINWVREGAGWQVDVPNLKNGNRTLSGQLQLTEDNRFSGAFAVSEVVLLLGTAEEQRDETASEMIGRLRDLSKYAGSIDLHLENVLVAGQQVDAPNSRLVVGDGAAQYSFGPEARVNGKAASFDLNVALENEIPFTLATNVEALELEPLFASENVANVMTSSLSGDLSLVGAVAHDSGIAKSLSGSGDFEGSAGQLKFISVGGLVSQIQSSNSGRSFLSGIGSLLRQGETPIGSLKTKFSVDGGVMLVETTKAEGDWGALTLDGQINLTDRFISMQGALALNNPPDTPQLPVKYEGPWDGVSANWSSRLFERFVIAGIERRMRASLFQNMEAKEAEGGAPTENPGLAVFSRAFGLLSQLKQQQEAQKQREAEALRRAEELKRAADSTPQGSEEQRP